MKLVRPVLYLLVAATVLQACTASFRRLHGERRDVTLSWAKYSRPLDGLAIYDAAASDEFGYAVAIDSGGRIFVAGVDDTQDSILLLGYAP